MNFLLTLIKHARREWRGAELKPVLAALLVAVAAATGVMAFTDRVERALNSRGSELVGGDGLLASRFPISQALEDSAREAGLDTTRVVAFPTVLFVGDLSVLVEIKAVESNYPLRGKLTAAPSVEEAAQNASPPAPGEMLLDPRAIAALEVVVGDMVEVGNARLRVAGVLRDDPEGAGSFLSFAPRALLHRDDVEALGLVGPASRAFHRLLIAGDQAQVKAFADAIRPSLKGVRLTLSQDAEQQLAEVARQARAFFGLAALSVLWLAALAIALTARRYTQARRDIVAQLRCFGLSRRRILLQLGGTLGVYALPAVALGVALGYGLQYIIAAGVEAIFAEPLPPPSARAGALGALVGVLAYFAFTMPALQQLTATSPARLLRNTDDQLGWRELAAYPIALLVLTGAIYVLTGEGQVGIIAFIGITVLALLIALVLGTLLRIVRWKPPGRRFATRQAWRQLASRPGTTLLSATSLALALTAVLLLGVVSSDLVRQWRTGLSAETPNRFLLNIQPDQRNALAERLTAIGIENVTLYPFAVGRLVAINGAKPKPEDFDDPRAARFIDGTLNLSWNETLPAANTLTSGTWWTQGDEVSIAENWAQSLGLKVGDSITVAIGDREVSARIASIRSVDWDSFRVNFFLLFKPSTMAGIEGTYITSVRTDAEQGKALGRLLREYPNLTLIDVDALLSRILGVVDAIVRSLSAIFWCALAAAACVLLAAFAVTVGARRFEHALWRSLGAAQSTLRATQRLELAAIGAIGGGFGGIAALATGWALAKYAFQIDYAAPWWIAPLGATIGIALCLSAGWIVLRSVSRTPPGQMLRA